MSACKSCGHPMIFIKTEWGKNAPCNAEETSIFTPSGKLVKGHIPHHITCPQAKDWRNKK